jgi:hypothetical protein
VTAKQQREAFAQPSPSSELAEQVGAKVASRLPDSGSRSARFVWFRDDEALTLLVGSRSTARWIRRLLLASLNAVVGRCGWCCQ